MWTLSTNYFSESFQSASSNSFKSQKVILEKPVLSAFLIKGIGIHCVKSVRIQSYSGPHHSDWMRGNADQNNTEYGQFLCSNHFCYSWMDLQL